MLHHPHAPSLTLYYTPRISHSSPRSPPIHFPHALSHWNPRITTRDSCTHHPRTKSSPRPLLPGLTTCLMKKRENYKEGEELQTFSHSSRVTRRITATTFATLTFPFSLIPPPPHSLSPPAYSSSIAATTYTSLKCLMGLATGRTQKGEIAPGDPRRGITTAAFATTKSREREETARKE